MNSLPLIVTTLQVLTAILGLFFIKKFKSSFYFILIGVLCLTAVVESLGLYYFKIEKSSYLLYVSYTFLIFNLIALAYQKIIKVEKHKYLLFIPILLFDITFIIIYFMGISYYNMIIFGAVITSLYVFLYLKQLLLSYEIISYKRLLPFWVSVGFLVFYLPSIPFFVLRDYMKNRGLFFVLSILIILMNTFIIYGLLCSNKEKKY
ncbi:hypothetical protein ACSIGC_08695 [Tenacibaculum sp. ZS6-P6]|uniref:hypothetical protein n=1 Tax=Tenacibaculum sp. ZS6-P6 TaxID=3447503 RepID=UPI003F97D2C1